MWWAQSFSAPSFISDLAVLCGAKRSVGSSGTAVDCPLVLDSHWPRRAGDEPSRPSSVAVPDVLEFDALGEQRPLLVASPACSPKIRVTMSSMMNTSQRRPSTWSMDLETNGTSLGR